MLCRIRLLRSFSHIFFFNDTATTEIYTLSLHDALPICIPWWKPGTNCICRPSNAPCQSWKADRKSTRLNSSHVQISYAVFCLKKKKQQLLLSGWIGEKRRGGVSSGLLCLQ